VDDDDDDDEVGEVNVAKSSQVDIDFAKQLRTMPTPRPVPGQTPVAAFAQWMGSVMSTQQTAHELLAPVVNTTLVCVCVCE
jgi:hypothetical protein